MNERTNKIPKDLLPLNLVAKKRMVAAILEMCETGDGYAYLGTLVVRHVTYSYSLDPMVRIERRLERLDRYLTSEFDHRDTRSEIGQARCCLIETINELKKPQYSRECQLEFIFLCYETLLLHLVYLEKRVNKDEYRGFGRY